LIEATEIDQLFERFACDVATVVCVQLVCDTDMVA
jgi:hypothetical protein